jgi:hypothetical protein
MLCRPSLGCGSSDRLPFVFPGPLTGKTKEYNSQLESVPDHASEQKSDADARAFAAA